MLFFSAEDLCSSILRTHRETSQYRVEDLQKWKLFSREEIQAYQNKVMRWDSDPLLHFPISPYILVPLFTAYSHGI